MQQETSIPPKIVSRYVKLLARANGTDNEHERESAINLANKLAEKYAGLADLVAKQMRAQSEQERVAEWVRTVTGRNPPQPPSPGAGLLDRAAYACWHFVEHGLLNKWIDALEEEARRKGYYTNQGETVMAADEDQIEEIENQIDKVSIKLGKARRPSKQKVCVTLQLPLTVWEDAEEEPSLAHAIISVILAEIEDAIEDAENADD